MRFPGGLVIRIGSASILLFSSRKEIIPVVSHDVAKQLAAAFVADLNICYQTTGLCRVLDNIVIVKLPLQLQTILNVWRFMNTYKQPPLDNIRARAEQVRRLIGMTDDPEMAMNLRCFAQGLSNDIDELTLELHSEGISQHPAG